MHLLDICLFHLNHLILGIKLFVKFPYSPFKFCGIGNDSSSFISDLAFFYFSLFFFVSLGQALSILLILFKEPTLPNFFPDLQCGVSSTESYTSPGNVSDVCAWLCIFACEGSLKVTEMGPTEFIMNQVLGLLGWAPTELFFVPLIW